MQDAAKKERNKVIIAANPFSGARSNRPHVERLVAALKEHHLEAHVAWTPEERSAMLADSDLRTTCRCVIAGGGDGTVHAIVNEDLPAPLAVMPLGTENLFAKHFGFTRDWKKLAERIARGQSIRVDMGEISGRRFALMFGTGIDGEIAHRLARWREKGKRLRRVSYLSYVAPILSAFTKYPFPRVELCADGECVTGSHVFVFNLPPYALGLRLGAHARADDGLLDWVVLEKPGRCNLLRYAWAIARGKHRNLKDVKHGRAHRVRITSDAPVPIQVDGDACGVTPLDAEIVPAALEVLGPAC